MVRLSDYTASGFVKDGELVIRNQRGWRRALAAFRRCEVVVTIECRHATRSVNQNAWYWAQVVGLVAEHTGHTPDEIHEIYKAMFLPKQLAIVDGNGEIQGEYVIGGSTTKLNRLQFGEFCEQARKWAAETLSVDIPDPDPLWRDRT